MIKQLTALTIVPLCLIFIYTGIGSSQSSDNTSSELSITEQVALADTVSANPDRKLMVYYFHGRKRCLSCRTIEGYTHNALKISFEELLENGRIEWSVRNYVKPEFRRYKDEFNLYTQSVVLVDMQGDKQLRWKNLKEVWTLIRDKKAFYDYIQNEVEAYLSEE